MPRPLPRRATGLALAALTLAGCATWDTADGSYCDDIIDPAARRACREEALRDYERRADNDGIGPPRCHPASTRPDPDRDEDC